MCYFTFSKIEFAWIDKKKKKNTFSVKCIKLQKKARNLNIKELSIEN